MIFFHIVSNYNKVIDQVRRQEYRRACADDKNVIKGSRWLLLKNPENLKKRDKPRLDALLATNESLAKVYILKDELKNIWKQTNRLSMENGLDIWCNLALDAHFPP